MTSSDDQKERLDAFRAWLQHEEGLSAGTVLTYSDCVRAALRRRSVVSVLKDDGTARSTKVTYRAALRRWAEFLRDDALLLKVNSVKLASGAGGKIPREVKPLTAHQAQMFQATIEKLHGKDGMPRWAWPALSIFRKLGLRAGVDLCQIRRDAVLEALETGSLRIWTKGERIRELPAGTVMEELEDLAGAKGWTTLADLIAPHAKAHGRQKAAYRAFTKLLKRISQELGIPADEVHSHRFRHTRALELYNKTKDIRKVQKFLGHADVNTTIKYLKVDLDELGEDLLALD